MDAFDQRAASLGVLGEDYCREKLAFVREVSVDRSFADTGSQRYCVHAGLAVAMLSEQLSSRREYLRHFPPRSWTQGRPGVRYLRNGAVRPEVSRCHGILREAGRAYVQSSP